MYPGSPFAEGSGQPLGRILGGVKAERLATLEAEIAGLMADPGRVRKKEGKAVDRAIEALDEGLLRVAEPVDGVWRTNAWVKEAILLYFARMDSVPIGPAVRADADPVRWRREAPSYFDKLPTNRNYER